MDNPVFDLRSLLFSHQLLGIRALSMSLSFIISLDILLLIKFSRSKNWLYNINLLHAYPRVIFMIFFLLSSDFFLKIDFFKIPTDLSNSL